MKSKYLSERQKKTKNHSPMWDEEITSVCFTFSLDCKWCNFTCLYRISRTSTKNWIWTQQLSRTLAFSPSITYQKILLFKLFLQLYLTIKSLFWFPCHIARSLACCHSNYSTVVHANQTNWQCSVREERLTSVPCLHLTVQKCKTLQGIIVKTIKWAEYAKNFTSSSEELNNSHRF